MNCSWISWNWCSLFAVALLAATVCAPAFAVEFPGPIPVNVRDEVVSAAVLPLPDSSREQLVLGTGYGSLRLMKMSFAEEVFSTYGHYGLGGRVVWIDHWEGLPEGQLGIVAATANPDRVWFLYVTDTYPYFEAADSVDLEEDPGTTAFLSAEGQEMPDLAVSLPGVDQIARIHRQGGVWSIAEVLDAGDQPHSVVSLNLDEDPELELLCANRGPLSRSLGRYDRDAAGDFELTLTQPLASAPRQMQLYDWNRDGAEDLVVSFPEEKRIAAFAATDGPVTELDALDLFFEPDLFLPRPLGGPTDALFVSASDRPFVEVHLLRDGASTGRAAYYPGLAVVGLEACDFNGDSFLDLACLGGQTEQLTVTYGKPDDEFWGYDAVLLTGNPGAAVWSDFTGDGRRDLVVTGLGQMHLDLFTGRAGGGLLAEPEPLDLTYYPGTAEAIELDGDAASELAVYDVISAEVKLMQHDPSDGFTQVGAFSPSVPISRLVVADLDNDGYDDVLCYSPVNGTIVAFFGLGAGAFTAAVDWSQDETLGEAMPLDLDGDGLLELLYTDSVSRVWYAANLDGRTLGEPEYVFAGAGARRMASGDFDGDEDPDLVVHNGDDGSLSFIENAGEGLLTRRIGGYVLSEQVTDLLCADLDGNGRDEVVMNLMDAGTIGAVYPFGDWQFGPVFQYPSRGDAGLLLGGDVNDDEVPDLLVLDASSQVGYTLPNVELIFVAVDPEALAVRCEGGDLVLGVRPDRPGPWRLEIVAGGRSVEVAASGFAALGEMAYEQGEWLLRLAAGTLETAGLSGPGRILLTIGEPGVAETLERVYAGACAPTGKVAPAVRWAQRPWPNPFNPIVRARFALDAAGPVEVAVHDLAGRRVRTLRAADLAAGEHELVWRGDTDAGPAPAGAYLLTVRTEAGLLSRKLLLLK